MLVILIIGIVIIILSGMRGAKDKPAGSTEYSRGEERLSEILSQIEGAGKVSVMLTYETDAQEKYSFSSNKNEIPRVLGVIVVADGAGDAAVKQQLREAVTAVTGVTANHVGIYKR